MQRIALNRQISLLSISGQKRPPNFANVVQWLGDYYEGTDGCYYLKDKSTTRTDAPRDGTYLAFNGTNNYVKSCCPMYSGTPSVDFTVNVHINSSNYGIGNSIYSEGNTLTGVQHFRFSTNGTGTNFQVFLRNNESITLINDVQIGDGTLTDGWHEVRYVDDNGSITIYLDGVEYGTHSYTPSGTITLDIATIGALGRTDYTNFFLGDIASFEGLNNRFPFEEYNVDERTCFDASGNDNDGTILGTITGVRQTDPTIPCYVNTYGLNEGGTANENYIPKGSTVWAKDGGWTEDAEGGLNYDFSGGAGNSRSVDKVVIGRDYQLTYTISESSFDGTLRLAVLTTSDQPNMDKSVGTHTVTFNANGTDPDIAFRCAGGTGGTLSISDYKLVDLYQATTIIPAQQLNPSLDAIGNPLTYKGKVGYDTQLVDSSVLELNQGSTEDNILNSNVLYTGGSFSASGIIKTGTLSQNPGFIFSDRTGTSFAFQFVLYLDGSFEWIIKTDSGTVSTIVVPSVVIGQYLSYKASIDVVAKSFSLEIENIVTGEIVSDTSSYTGDLVVDGNNIVLGWYFSGVGSRAFKGEFLNFKFGNKIDYVFGEATGDTVHNKIDGQPHGTITGTEPYFGTSDLQRPNNLIDGFDLWQNDTDQSYLYVPFDVNGNSIKTDGDTITGYTWVSKNEGISSNNVYNGSETLYLHLEAPALITSHSYLDYDFAYGVEKVSEGDIPSDQTSWIQVGDTVIGDGYIRVISVAAALSYGSQENVFEVGKKYEVSFNVVETDGNSLLNLGSTISWDTTTTGLKRQTITATETTLTFKRQGTCDITIGKQISVKEVGDTTPQRFSGDNWKEYDNQGKHVIFSKLSGLDEPIIVEEVITYSAPQTELIDIYLYLGIITEMTGTDGVIEASDGKIYYYIEGVNYGYHTE